jgi:hypothetical protein
MREAETGFLFPGLGCEVRLSLDQKCLERQPNPCRFWLDLDFDPDNLTRNEPDLGVCTFLPPKGIQFRNE